MALDGNRLDDFAGMDEIVVNQRVRAVRPGTPYGTVAAAPGGQFGTLWMQGTGVATNFTTGSQTLTAAMLGGGLIVGSPSAAVTYTLDTAANLQTYMNNNSAGIQVGDILVCDIINAGSSTGTITVNVGTGGSFDSGQNNNLQMPINTSRTLFIRFTAVGTSPTYVAYG